MYTNIHKSFEQHSSELSTAHSPSASERTNVVHPHRAIPLSNKKEGPLRHTATWIKLKNIMLSERPDEREYILDVISFIKKKPRKEKSNQKQRKAHQGLPQSQAGWEQGTSERSGVLPMFYNVVMGVHTCQNSKSYK